MKVISGIKPGDRERIKEILESSGFFYDFEVGTALEIADETLARGMAESGYFWLSVFEGERMEAFCNYGKNDFSVHSWDLYWIAVDQDARQMGYGSQLLKAVEEDVILRGGNILWIETSGRSLYVPTESFYRRNGYVLEASLKDFYGPGDPKQVYKKVLRDF